MPPLNRRQFLADLGRAGAVLSLPAAALGVQGPGATPPPKVDTIYLCHHSHTDIGYTADQPIIEELHGRFLDRALELIERSRGRGEAAFRWTCEGTMFVEPWLERAGTRDRKRFLAAAEHGDLEVTAMWCNVTPLAPMDRLLEMLEPALRLRRRYGLRVRAAMNSDVNGQNWGLADALLDAGIEGFSMSINEDFGGAPPPRPGAFLWHAPSGRRLLVWNGNTYAHTAWLGVGLDFTAAQKNLEAMVAALRADGYPWPFVYMQITHPGPQNDNMGPIPQLSDWVARFNQRGSVRLVLTTPSTFFDRLRREAAGRLPTLRGDWSDWWNFGTASTPRQTAINRASQVRLRQADLLAAACAEARDPRVRRVATRGLDLWNEHTWGADWSIGRPDDPDVLAQWNFKADTAYRARALTTLLRRDGLRALERRIAAGKPPAVLVFNPTAQPRHETVLVPRRLLEASETPQPPPEIPPGQTNAWPADLAWQNFPDRQAWQDREPIELGPLSLPPFGWTVVRASDAARPAEKLRVEAQGLATPTLSLRARDGQPGLASLRCGEREWVGPGLLPFGVVLLEQFPRDRGQVCHLDWSMAPARSPRPVWNPRVAIQRQPPSGECQTATQRSARTAVLTQNYSLPTCRALNQQWRLAAEADQVELVVRIDKLAVTDPHSLYLALPFQAKPARVLAEVAGAVIDPATERIPGTAPWLSLQGGFCVGDERGTVYVATPDTPMVQLERFQIGASQIGGQPVAQPGLALVWLYNNLWSTNFKAAELGEIEFRFVLGFSAQPPDAARLVAFAERAASRLLWHPLAAREGGNRSWPSTGELWRVEPGPVQVFSLRPAPTTDHGGRSRLLLYNPTAAAAKLVLRAGVMPLADACLVDATGRPLERVPVRNGTLACNVPARRTVCLEM